jgi:magnesium transporter
MTTDVENYENDLKTGRASAGNPCVYRRKTDEDVKITMINYDQEHIETRVVRTVEECFPYKDQPTVTWINVDGLHDTTILERLGTQYGLHALTIADLLNTQQRLKVDIFEDHLFIVLKMHTYDQDADE